jgi:hypothetical protein
MHEMALGQDAPYGSVCSVPRELNISTLIASIVYTKVFASVHRNNLWEIMNEKSFSQHFMNNRYHTTNDKCGKKCHMLTAVKQILSPSSIIWGCTIGQKWPQYLVT